ncbi:HsdM family class I SAM-dependent methyltransferase [Gloeothece verrucosa]|uniref:site-specific DNA-methyltransferase (adenine-specific) n=1 Tax=Gloeothece verrucosa (strain PCC 7822) TaxID=497965 RepID=E0UFK8_GLOV7|nr:N-6 DNA methylase [Gloeothece verrucosa]ADN16702.1 Eco57I restriction endonuclease [Gloeothece verrucosa PCC 7822]
MQNFPDKNFSENEYCKSVSLEHRKKYAQFFTPYPIAYFMAKWILGNPDCQTILDPAFGLGVFARAILDQTNTPIKISGFELDRWIFTEAKQLIEKDNISLYNQDYLFTDWDKKYDGIIGNPPYLKFHSYDNKNSLKEIENKLGITLSGLTNLYTLFLLKSLAQIKPNGRIAYIVPSEFLNSDYGKGIKEYLLKDGKLRYILILDFQETIFNDVVTTSSILLFANDGNAQSLEFIPVKSIAELEKLPTLLANYPQSLIGKKFSYSQIEPKKKWRLYYQTQQSLNFKNLVPFSQYGKVIRGIATGANEYFTFNAAKQKQYHISEQYLLPCITKANDVTSPFFTLEHLEELKAKNKNIFVLNATELEDEHLKKYIELGEINKIHKKYLTSHRNPWYSLEKRSPAPLWVSVFNRNGLRFIKNEAKIRNLTTFHGIYLNFLSANREDLLFAYLLTDVSKKIFQDNRREYGNGLEKFEPNDINTSLVINLDSIDSQEAITIIELLKAYRISVLSRESQPELLDELEEIFRKILTK